jgi:hypothetical protein
MGHKWATLFLGEINTGTCLSMLGKSKKNLGIKYGHDSRGTQTRERMCWRGPATSENYRPDLLSERAPHITEPVTV